MLYWVRRQTIHRQQIEAYKVRIHVNGIRGKSTVTRLIAGVLREAGYRTVAKTTGSAAVTSDPDGNDVPIERQGAANVKEQQDIIASWQPLKAEVMVMECMALQPQYQEWAERMVIQADIGVITNVREDHQDVMGETLPEIAVSLAHMCPTSVVVSTLLYKWTGTRSGGFLTAAYAALFILQPLHLLFILATGILVYFFVTHFLMHYTPIFGRTKFAMMVLTGLVFTWTLEVILAQQEIHTLLIPAGFSVISSIIAALIANDGERQGVKRTLAGATICTLVVFAAIKSVDLLLLGQG